MTLEEAMAEIDRLRGEVNKAYQRGWDDGIEQEVADHGRLYGERLKLRMAPPPLSPARQAEVLVLARGLAEHSDSAKLSMLAAAADEVALPILSAMLEVAREEGAARAAKSDGRDE